MNTKVCTKCKVEKALSEFPKGKAYKDGFKYNCKVCARAYESARRKRNAIYVDMSDPVFRETKKICPKCKESKYVVYFSLDSTSKDGLQHHCKLCVDAYNKERYEKGPDLSDPVFKEKTKVCSKCLVRKDKTEFYKHNMQRDGFVCQCKECERELYRIYCLKHKDRGLREQALQVKTKICTKCGIEKSRSEFSRHRVRTDGLRSRCKECEYKYYYLRTRKESLARRKEYRKTNKDKYLREEAIRRKAYSSIRSARHKHRMATDMEYKLRLNIRNRQYNAIKKAFSNASVTHMTDALLGCTYVYLKKYLSSKFYPHPETGVDMSWSNYGEWNLDHIRPLSWFGCEDLESACHYSNLQPMWASENFSKHNTVAYRVETPWLKYDRDGNLVE